LLTQEKYQQWIDDIRESHFPLPDVVIKDMNNWRHRSILARALFRVKKYQSAIELFKSILDVEINTEEPECFNLSEVEDRVWCLMELAMCLWKVTGKRREALVYCHEALVFIDRYPKQFNFMDKREVWSQIQDFIFFTSRNKVRRAKNSVVVRR
jgi:tetratricopeptide (TPR) repeat protein